MTNIPVIVAGFAFVTLAAANMVVMLEASQSSRSAAARNRLIAAHRVGGYLFMILLCIMAYSMSQRLASVGITSHLPTHLVLHIVLVLVLVPLLFLKILIARRYKHSHSSLKALGVTIFVISFVLVSIPTLSELLRSTKPGSMTARFATGLLVAACLVQCARVLKKRNQAFVTAESSRPIENPAIAPSLIDRENARKPMNLVLSQIEQQTHDSRTLRFEVPKEMRFRAKPGQFLTFHWMVEGQRKTRSYTISSSPIHENYVEITSKKTKDGCVSIFLNERANLGLRVEASGPYGQFCFDDKLHKNIVLIAAGSGITPMISMLRYIDDLKLSTSVTLLYGVRTGSDIIFKNELARLERSLPNFKYEVCLSQPDPAWKGRSGRFTEDLVSQYVTDVNAPIFFVCGPSGFMDSALQILSNLGVRQERILKESFGESKRPTKFHSQEVREVETVVFIQSQKVCQVSADCTLLDLAERNGVLIPYGCRQGICGTCATRVLSGTARMDVEAGLTPEQKIAGYVLPCVSRAEGTVVLSA